MSLMLPPKLISLERAQELSKSGKLSGSLNSSELLNQSEAVMSPPKVNPPVKYRDHDKSKPHERRLELSCFLRKLLILRAIDEVPFISFAFEVFGYLS